MIPHKVCLGNNCHHKKHLQVCEVGGDDAKILILVAIRVAILLPAAAAAIAVAASGCK